MALPPYIHLHVHSDYSMLDGLGKPQAYVSRAAELKMPALALTDHGTLSGAYEFYMACKRADIRPLIGVEFYFVPDASVIKEEKIGERFHVVMLANNVDGYRTLIQLNNIAHRNFYYKPVIDRAACEAVGYEESENITVLSGCASSILSRKVLGQMEGSVTEELSWWRETFPHFNIELQHHGSSFDRKLNKGLLKLAHKYKLPWVVTNDPHYVFEEEEDCHDALLAIQTASDFDDPDRFSFDGSGYHLRTRAEMVKAFKKYGADIYKPGIANSARIARSIDLRIPEWDNKSWHIPKFTKIPKGLTSDTLLKKLAIRGLKDRGLFDDEKYVERTKYELKQIKSIPGFADFLLITWDIINRARNNKTEKHPRGIPVGPGRGSTSGCLVGYLIGIHKVDSLRYNLLFERFLNPARPKMPDIDTDFSQEFREEVMEDIVAEYGADNVLPVAAFQTMKTRGAFRKLATCLGMPFKDLTKFVDIMDEAWGTEDEDDDGEEDHIRTEHLPEELVEGYPDLIEFIDGIHGTKSAISRHPAGLIIFDPEDSIRSLVPEMWVVSSKKFASMFDLKSAEAMGLMKQDILGLRTLDTIDQCVELVEWQLGETLDPDSWVPDEEDRDRDIYRMLARGRIAGVFQLEGGTMATGITKFKPRRFEDIVACTSIYRKGPMLTGAPERYIENKKNKHVKVAHESLRPILEKTWGEMAYQEQLMEIASVCGGFDQGGVADLLAAVRFKDPEMMEPLREKFVAGMIERTGASNAQANTVWGQMEKQASYLFNRCHAVAYSLLTYQTARLKKLYPLQYFTALMRTVPAKNKGDKEKRLAYLAEASDMGYRILPPDINESDYKMTCGEDDEGPWMRFGLTDVKGIGMPTAEKIMHARIENEAPFRSMKEIMAALTPGLVQKLDDAGCFHDLKGGAKRDMRALEEIVGWQFDDVMGPYRKKFAKKVRLPGKGAGRVRLIGEVIDTNKKKTKNGNPYMTWRIRWTPSDIYTITIWQDADIIWDTAKGSIVLAEGKWNPEFRNISVGDPDQVRILATPN